MRYSVLVVTMSAVIAACGAVADGGSGTTTPAPATTTVPLDTTTSLPNNGLSDRIELAKTDLAAHLDVDRSTIELVSAEAVSWSDGSVGCPEPGMNYTQAIVPGYLIVLGVDGTEYRYHGATDEDPWRCDRDPLNPIRP